MSLKYLDNINNSIIFAKIKIIDYKHENITDMASKKRRSLETTRGRSKPLVAKGGITRSRTPYKCGGKAKKK